MKSLDDFARFMYPGKHMRVPKSKVPHPKSEGWEDAIIYMPMRGSVGSYRKGRMHVHDIEAEGCWDLHVDNVDPKEDPVGHVIRDAPELIGIALAALFVTVAFQARKFRSR